MAKKTTKAKAPEDPITEPEKEVDPHVRAIAQRLGELRERAGISRNALAEAAGIHGTHMGQFLLGRQGISLEVLARAAERVGAALLTERDEKR